MPFENLQFFGPSQNRPPLDRLGFDFGSFGVHFGYNSWCVFEAFFISNYFTTLFKVFSLPPLPHFETRFLLYFWAASEPPSEG